ncbi:MAG: hypothetical protein LBK50_00975 [Candidatus Nomurabacteria bacterium]|jgi:hypothetical protein|nr:hypothetical protein [Candidatus Nomurabacteria bacterium]
MKEQWKDIMREVPVAVNNFYGDPVVQWADTVSTLNDLAKTEHRGPVGIITKGKMCDRHIKDLSDAAGKGSNIVPLISISELSDLEGTPGEHRYENIRKLGEIGLSPIAYVRPLMPPYNTSEAKLEKIFSSVAEAGGKSAVISGFRGDEALIEKMSPDERTEWALRVKIIPNEIYERIKHLSEKYGVQLFTRTACAVAHAVGGERTYNPYYNSPNLVKCDELDCPLRESCGPLLKPREGSMELLRHLGYDVEFVPATSDGLCQVSGAERLKCPSCCTTCYRVPETAHIKVNNDVKLGDLAFIRFVTGIMSMQPGKNDGGDKDVAKITLPNYPEIDNIQGLNSWWPISRNTDKCYGCKYCIVNEYYNENEIGKKIGFPPAELIDKIGGQNG